MSMTKVERLLAASILLSVAGCGGGGGSDTTETGTGGEGGGGGEGTVATHTEPPPPPPPSPAKVRVIHLAVGLSETPLAATAGPGEISDIGFLAGGAYTEIPMTGDTMTLPVSVTAGEVTASVEAPLRAGVPATLFVISAEDAAQIALSPTEDEAGAVTGQIRGRYVNAFHGVPSVDFCIPGATARDPGRAIFGNVEYGRIAGTDTPAHYIPVPMSGESRIQVRQANPDRPCTGRVLGTAAVPAPDGSVPHNVTLVAVGRMRGRPAVPRQLLVCEDAPGAGTCTAIPMQ
jgi:hypothetical protein